MCAQLVKQLIKQLIKQLHRCSIISLTEVSQHITTVTMHFTFNSPCLFASSSLPDLMRCCSVYSLQALHTRFHTRYLVQPACTPVIPTQRKDLLNEVVSWRVLADLQFQTLPFDGRYGAYARSHKRSTWCPGRWVLGPFSFDTVLSQLSSAYTASVIPSPKMGNFE